MSTRAHTEDRFEEAAEAGFLAAGWQAGDPKAYDGERHLFPADVLAFVEATQAKKLEAVRRLHQDRWGEALLAELVRELGLKGSLHVLRHGFKAMGRTFRLTEFKPNTTMNEAAAARYAANVLRVTRQVSFASVHPGEGRPARPRIDLVLSIGGLPVVTMELKNPMTGTRCADAARQYREERSPRDLLFKFKHRALVHLAVDPDEAMMTTKLDGGSTVFLPFNRGRDGGAGNPPHPSGHRTAYLWEEAFTPDSLLEIVQRFVHLEVSERKAVSTRGRARTVRKETMIFPRYHQLDAVRRLALHARAHGPGRNYLVEHSAGSGKSNSIAWLAHRLSGLHDAGDQKIFDGVVVVTDRRVLDKQLQDTIYQIEHRRGVVEKIDEDARQLARALSDGTPIVVTTIQKFPFVAQAIERLAAEGEDVRVETAGKRFAVIIDEAHSGQGGDAAQELKKTLSGDQIMAAVADQTEGEEPDETERAAIQAAASRARQPNLSYFAFTATPKFRTRHVFDEPGASGAAPFHLYSMRQAIEEGFILDVLKSYTTYKRYYALVKQVEDDPVVKRKAAAKRLARFVEIHPHNVAQVTEIVVEHFRTHVAHEMGGKAKAMVVTDSRLAATRYKRAFDEYVKSKGYKGLSALVAFSGTVDDPKLPGVPLTESGMNGGLSERELPEAFETADHQVLIVADKYQTGFDQPLLQAMYVVRPLTGVKAVQTLSRLNRRADGKERTFVLDFANEAADIQAAFEQFYDGARVEDAPDAHRLYELQHEVFETQVVTEDDVAAFSRAYFRPGRQGASMHAAMERVLSGVEAEFRAQDEEVRSRVRSLLGAFQGAYAFLSQIIPFGDSDLERLYALVRHLSPRLREPDEGGAEPEGDIALQYYRAQLTSQGSLTLGEEEGRPLRGFADGGSGDYRDEEVPLAELVDQFNERFGTEFTQADQLFFDQVEAEASADEAVIEAVMANSRQDFEAFIAGVLPDMYFDRMEGNERVVNRMLSEREMQAMAERNLAGRIYDRVKRELARRHLSE